MQNRKEQSDKKQEDKETKKVKIIGGGLAGCEAAYYLAERGVAVELFDIKPNNFTAAHKDKNLAELVCSNSLKNNDFLSNACGLLKEEMRILGSLIIAEADKVKVPAGAALAVNRYDFSKNITDKIVNHKNIKFICKEVDKIDFSKNNIIATGPLTTKTLSNFVSDFTGSQLYFYDAAAPIVTRESLNMDFAFIADRYGHGENGGDYINCPMDKDTYQYFVTELLNAEKITLHNFESNIKNSFNNNEVNSFNKSEFFDGCMPIEIMAERGIDTLKFGPLKPTGLDDPKTGRWPYACLQLRKENTAGDNYNLVGFQTNLKFSEQKRVFSIIKALENAEYLRYGVMHRNTYINSPKLLNNDFSLKEQPFTFFAGQITGVEGYVESAASGLMCGINMYRKLFNKNSMDFSEITMLGALSNYIARKSSNFQPMNANYGILKPLEEKIRDKKLKKEKLSIRAINKIKELKGEL